MCNIPHCCLPQESGPCLSPNVAGRPLRPATDRSLGGPLPRQQANQTRAHPVLPELSPQGHAAPREYAVLAAVSGCCPPVRGRLPTRCSPVRHSVPRGFPPEGSAAGASFDLHVLGTPPAFILSQDQTLMLRCSLRHQNQAWLNFSTDSFTVLKVHIQHFPAYAGVIYICRSRISILYAHPQPLLIISCLRLQFIE